MIPEKIRTLLRSKILADNIIGMELVARSMSIEDILKACRDREIDDLDRAPEYVLIRTSRYTSVILGENSLFIYDFDEGMASGADFTFIEHRINHKDLTL